MSRFGAPATAQRRSTRCTHSTVAATLTVSAHRSGTSTLTDANWHAVGRAVYRTDSYHGCLMKCNKLQPLFAAGRIKACSNSMSDVEWRARRLTKYAGVRMNSASSTAFHGYELHGRIAKEQDCAGSRPTIHLAAGGV